MKYGIGQLVRVKYFKDLVKDNKVDSNGDITIGSCIFLREMKVYCGEVYKIKNVFGDEYELLLKDGGQYYFTSDMLELPNKAENDTISHETKQAIQEDMPTQKRVYTRKKVE